ARRQGDDHDHRCRRHAGQLHRRPRLRAGRRLGLVQDRAMIARFRSESGVTILEMSVSIALISIVSAVFLPIMDTATRSVPPLQAQSVAVDDLRSSLAMIGRELRSALCVTQPSASGSSGNVLLFTTEAN